MNIDIDITGKVIKTKNLILREFTYDDLDDFFEYASVDGVGQMAGWLPHKDKDESLAILKMFIDKKITFAIEYEGKVIGSSGIELYNEEALPEFDSKKGREIGLVIAKDYWNRGFGKEALKAILDYLFFEVGVDFVVAGYFVENLRSKNMQASVGFKPYKEFLRKTRYGEERESMINILEKEKWMQ